MSEPGPARTAGRGGGWRLADRTSAYLKGAADQPIEWYPWGPEPFALAERLGRPILLDIGAVWCHWCHVMDEGTYTDPQVAQILREEFVAVKVDRDESPEIDRRYQRQVGALTGEGGWPLTAFLTPKGEVFLGGTYFPPEDGMGRPGFRRLLTEVAQWWKQDPEAIRRNTEGVRAALERMGRVAPSRATDLGPFVDQISNGLDEIYDPAHGGFGHAPKFPHPVAVRFLFWRAFARGDDRAGARGLETLRRMAEGGMYDQLVGGFHRYSVDEGWHIPHFEKMAADNAALLGAYVEGGRRSSEPIFGATVRGIVAWTASTLGDPKGGFGASQDADNAPGDDGSFFTWTKAELRSALDADELRLAGRLFGLGTQGEMPHDRDRNVLFLPLPLAEVAESLRIAPARAAALRDSAYAKLRAVRALRPSPIVDRALYANLNGSYIRALVEAGRFLGDPVPLALARAAADRFLSSAYDPERGVAHAIVQGSGSGWGHLDDQAEFGLGLVELAGATLDARYLSAATALADLVGREFAGDGGLLRDLAPRLYDGPTIGNISEPSYPLEDQPHLAANAAWDLLQIRLAALTDQDVRRASVRPHLEAVAARIRSAGLFAAGSALAAGLLETEPARVVIEGSGPAAEALARAAERTYHPNLWVFRGEPPEPFSLPAALSGAASASALGPRARLCLGTHCLAPIGEPEALSTAIASAARPPER